VVNALFLKDEHVAPAQPGEAARSAQGEADHLVERYRYLCPRAARRFLRSGLERSDLEQIAAIGLIKASRRYEPATQTPFEAYAWLIVLGELLHYVRDYERIIRIPRRLRSLETRHAQAHEACIARFGREPNDAELAAELGVLEATLAELRRAVHTSIPLDIEHGEASNRLANTGLSLEDRILFDAAFASLSVLERRVIAGVYLLGLTQLELSRRLGLPARRVSRIHHAALARMQRTWSS